MRDACKPRFFDYLWQVEITRLAPPGGPHPRLPHTPRLPVVRSLCGGSFHRCVFPGSLAARCRALPLLRQCPPRPPPCPSPLTESVGHPAFFPAPPAGGLAPCAGHWPATTGTGAAPAARYLRGLRCLISGWVGRGAQCGRGRSFGCVAAMAGVGCLLLSGSAWLSRPPARRRRGCWYAVRIRVCSSPRKAGSLVAGG